MLKNSLVYWKTGCFSFNKKMVAVKKRNLPIHVIPSPSPSLRKNSSPQPPPSPRRVSSRSYIPAYSPSSSGARCGSRVLFLAGSFWTVFSLFLSFFAKNMSKRAGEVEDQNDTKKLNPQLADPINITKWIEDNKSSFLPPVCNKMMWVVLESA